jgi:serine/threonine-protein kinase
MSKGDAKQRLEAEGFKVSITTGSDGSDPANEVTAQDPRGGADADKDSTVTITVASGFNTVPNVDGLSESEATDRLRDAGFTVKLVNR